MLDAQPPAQRRAQPHDPIVNPGTHPAQPSRHIPRRAPAPASAGMSYDAATSTAVLFGGVSVKTGRDADGTWTWDGATWAKQAPAASPSPR